VMPERKAQLREYIRAADARNEVLMLKTEVLTEVLDALDSAEKWVADLQSGMYINCVYCGHRYGPRKDTPVAMAEVLRKHIEQCPEHPLSAMKVRAEKAETDLKDCRALAGLERMRSASDGGIARIMVRDKKNRPIKLFAVIAGEDAKTVADFLKELDPQ
jgi:hypothetical protein